MTNPPAVSSSVTGAWYLVAVTAITMLAFAANSLLTRLALQQTAIDAATFTSIRLIAGALTLALIIGVKKQQADFSRISIVSALLLFIYAAAFSFAYRGMDTGSGALVLFASSQLLMIAFGLWRGERTSILGVVMALGGLIIFLAPTGNASIPLGYAALMLIAGFAWGGFSLLGRSGSSPITSTASSFILTVPLALGLLLIQQNQLHLDFNGAAYAALAGSVTSALGYVIWYWVRVRMAAITAGTVQLSVPIISAILGVLILDESVSIKSALAAAVVLLGVALTTRATKVKK